ncbi:MAG: hypothetical protein LBV00_04160 [Propionibacteriaceae bacterium]|jgi:hypothetical protein|nr:hypothetical protein [Propionibacteriaceae bacterium]
MTRYDDVMTAARTELTGLIRQKDAAGIAAIRSMMAEVENACAIPADKGVDRATIGPGSTPEGGGEAEGRVAVRVGHDGGEAGEGAGTGVAGEADEPSQHIAGAGRHGLTEAQRRVLSDAEVDQIVRDEIVARREEVATFERLGRDREAAIAGYQAALLQRVAHR